MQIHEITKNTLQEGLFDTFKTPDQIAAQAAKKLQARGAGQARPQLTATQAIDAVNNNTTQQQYINGLTTQWAQIAPKSSVVTPTQTKTATTPQRSALPSITVGGKLLTKGGDGLWHGETGAAVTDPAQVAKIDRAYQDQEYRKKQMAQTANIKEAFRTPQQTANLKSQRRQVTAPASQEPVNQEFKDYASTFWKWASEKLRTKEDTTGQIITLDQVLDTGVKDELKKAYAQVVQTSADPQKNVQAVNKFLTIAVAGITMLAQTLRQSGTSTVGQAVVTQQDIRNRLSQEVGLNNNQISALKTLAQDPATKAALLKSLGTQA